MCDHEDHWGSTAPPRRVLSTRCQQARFAVASAFARVKVAFVVVRVGVALPIFQRFARAGICSKSRLPAGDLRWLLRMLEKGVRLAKMRRGRRGRPAR
eukprot:2620886-Alexandrium_andersonii.AAC.1